MIDRIFAAPKGTTLEAGIEFALAHELDYEIPTFYQVENLDKAPQEIARYRHLFSNFQGQLSMHGPIFDTNVVSQDPEILKISQYRYRQAIEVAKTLDVRYLIFHSQWTPVYKVANVTGLWLNQVTDFWLQVLEEDIKDSNLTILIENFMDETPESIHTLVSRVNSPQLRACLDIGHVNIFSSMSPIDWLQALGGQVAYIHAHNNGGALDSHDSFEKGLIDMDSFLNHLALLPQKIHLAIETATIEGLASSYAMIQPHLAVQKEQFCGKSFLI